jgi:YVTN family beta-propeller protein
MLPALTATAYLLVAAPLPAAAQIAYVTSIGNGRVVSVDTVSGRQGPAIMVPAPGGLAITPDGKTVYVTSNSGNSVTPIDTATNTAEAPIAIGGSPNGIAVSPDGRTVYVTSANAHSVTPIDTATKLAGPAITVDQPTNIAIAPDGRTAYVLSAGNTLLTPIDLTKDTTRPPIALSHKGQAVAITPDGRLALVPQNDSPLSSVNGPSYLQLVNLVSGQAEAPIQLGNLGVAAIAVAPDALTAYISEYSIGTPLFLPISGSVIPISGSVLPFAIPSRSVGSPILVAPLGSVADLAVTGDSATVFATVPCNDYHCVSGGVFVLDTATHTVAGGLNVSGLSPVSWGMSPGPIALVPDPSAAFTAVPAQTGSPSSFDATASTDSGGSVTSYSWRFGDNTPPAITAAPTVSHIYSQPGSYEITLTTTSHGGCAAIFVYTGQTASCTGSPTATTTRTITVASPVTTATTGSVTNRTRTRARVHGKVHAVGEGVSWQFQYGTSTRYGNATPVRTLPPEHGQVSVSSTLTRLAPNTRYHYRLIVQTSEGSYTKSTISYGQDMTFTTRATGSLLLRSHALTLVGRTTEIALHCASRYPCRGRLSLNTFTHIRQHSQLVTVACGSARIRVTANRTTRVRVTIGPSCLSIVRHAQQRPITAKLTTQLSSGQHALISTIRLAL